MRRRKNKKERIVKIGDKLVKVYTISQVANLLDRSSFTLRKMEERGLFPLANFRMPPKILSGGSIREGDRIYTDTLVQDLVPIFKTISQGVKIKEDTLQQIKNSFAKEKQMYGN